MELDRYKDHHIEYQEVSPIPSVCEGCNDDCGECENAGLRWVLSPKDELILQRKAKSKAIERLLREIDRIDKQIEGIDDGTN